MLKIHGWQSDSNVIILNTSHPEGEPMLLRKILTISLLLMFFSFSFPMLAHAYLDPGTGSYILQLALAAIVGALFAVRLFWGRIKAFFTRLFSKQESDEHDEEE
jgi:hypothetical protein